MNSEQILSDESAMLVRLRAGDDQAFEAFYNANSRNLYRNILRIVKDREVAQDLLQNVFIKVWEAREVIDPDNAFKSYVNRIARNMVYNYLKKTALETQVTAYLVHRQTETYAHVEEEVQGRETETILSALISQLPPQRQKVFVLCKIEGKSYQEVSELLGISVATINDHVVKATRFLKSRLHVQHRVLSLSALLLLAGWQQ